MTFNSFLSCLMSKVSIEITINTSKWHERAKQWNDNSHISSQVDRFSLHCNSIQSTVSIVHLRVILTYLIPLLRVYINQHSSNAIQSNFVQQCIQLSTRINILQCTYVHHSSVLHCVYSTMVC